MAEGWDIYGNQTDPWGFTRYSLAVHASTSISDKVMGFRNAIGLADLSSEPHVSISAALFQPIDLEDVKRKVAQAASSAVRFRMQFESQALKHGTNCGGLAIVPTGALLALRDTMQDAVLGMIQSGGDPNRTYQPHMTLYQGADADETARARQVAGDFDFGDGFDVTSIELVGRVGPPRGGTRGIIASYVLEYA